jgi:hypothetical protein
MAIFANHHGLIGRSGFEVRGSTMGERMRLVARRAFLITTPGYLLARIVLRIPASWSPLLHALGFLTWLELMYLPAYALSPHPRRIGFWPGFAFCFILVATIFAITSLVP